MIRRPTNPRASAYELPRTALGSAIQRPVGRLWARSPRRARPRNDHRSANRGGATINHRCRFEPTTVRDKKEKKAAAEETAPAGPPPTPRLWERYQKEVLPGLAKKFGRSNPMSLP